MIEIETMWLAVFLGAVIGAVFLGARLLAPGGRPRGAVWAAVALLLLAAVGIRVPGGGGARDVLLVDVSHSTGVGSVDLQEEGGNAGLLASMTSVVAFGRTALVVESDGSAWPAFGPPEIARLGRDGSDLAAGLRLASELIEPGGRVVVLTDGRIDGAGLAAAASAVRAGGAGIEVRAFGRRIPRDARVETLRLVPRVAAGRGAVADVSVAGPPGAGVEVRLATGGGVSVSRRLVIPGGGRGAARLRLAGLPEGYTEVTATVVLPGDRVPENDRLTTGLVVAGVRRALLVNAPALAPLLEAAGFEVTTRESLDGADLSGPDLVVVRDLPSTAMPGGGGAVRDYVEGGGGLLLLGGPRAFGPGGYSGRPIEDCLPLESSRDEESLLVVLLIDRSGTMAGGKLDEARRAAKRLVLALPDDAALLIVPFAAGVEAAAGTIELSSREGRTAAERAVDGIPPASGSTRLVPPLALALEEAARQERRRSVVMLLTDGRLDGGETEAEVVAAGAGLRGAPARLAAIAVGEDADLPLLTRLCGEGVEPIDLREGGEIETAFLLALLRAEGEGKVLLGTREVRRGPGVDSPYEGGLTPVEGLVRTWARPGADVWFTAAGDLPLVAARRYGLGTSIAVATDPLGEWAGAWAGTGLLGALAERGARPEALAGARVELSVRDGRLEVVSHGAGDGAFLDARLTPGGGRPRPIRLRASGESRYVGSCAAPPPGGARLALSGFDGGVSIPYAAEYGESGPDEAGLSRVRSAVGEEGGEGARTRDASWVPALLALLLLILDRAVPILSPRLFLKRVSPAGR